MLTGVRIIDLTQPLGAATPPWPGGRGLEAEVGESFETGGSAYHRRLSLDEHLGTHIDAPAHFARDGIRVEAIPVDQLVRPAVVVDVREAAAADRDLHIPAATFEGFEAEHGTIQPGTAVLVLTGWDKLRGDDPRYVTDLHFPGLATDAARLLVDREVAGIGIDTLGIDPGNEDTFPVHQITLPAGMWHLEGLVALDELPPTGAWIVVGAARIEAASGAPARVIALVP